LRYRQPIQIGRGFAITQIAHDQIAGGLSGFIIEHQMIARDRGLTCTSSDVLIFLTSSSSDTIPRYRSWCWARIDR